MKRKIIILMVVLSVTFLIWFFTLRSNPTTESEFQFTELARGDLENLVSCTGTLEVVGAVEVGTELSGTVSKVFVDYNDDVRKNQVLAILDTTQLALSLRSAKSDLIKAEAQYELSKKQFENDAKMFEKNYISELDLQSSKTSLRVNYANLESARINLEKAEQNINKYSVIRSPLNGKVIYRSIEEGQTVAASLSSPTLFYIAEDLSRMEIYAYVDESDIGLIEPGQTAIFTVEAYGDETFEGTVKQIRLQPETVSNVVTYTVIVEADNRDDLLLPGMTATIDFVIEQKLDVVMVSNAALSFTPDRTMISEMMERKRTQMKNNDTEAKERPQRPSGSQKMMNSPKLWYLDENGDLQAILVETGYTDGVNTELTDAGKLEVGMQVISKQLNATEETDDNNSRRMPMMRPF
jgi:HlyD family secretion protein